MTAAPASLLQGIRVIDMTNVLAGPYAGYQLALLGADVIKVEVPGAGDLARNLGTDAQLNADGLGISFLAQNAQKRSLTVNLKTPGGRKVFEDLLRTADVLIENFRPGVLTRLGFSPERVREIAPQLVLCAISGFGQDGPRKDAPAYDQIIQGASGMMDVTGHPDGESLRAGYPIADTLGGLAAAFAISSALVGRARTGTGCVIDVSMLETAVTALGWVVSNHLVGGAEPARLGNENGTAAPSGTFQTAEGQLNIAANKQEQFETLCTALGREDLVGDPRFAHREDRKRHRVELTVELEGVLRTRPAREWEEILSARNVPAGAVLTVPQMLASPQILARELVHELPFPGADHGRGPLRVLGHGIHVDGRAHGPVVAPPTLGEHTDRLLAELGYSSPEIDRLHREGDV
ncbi:CaiB/BaiF CoA transferase family protein [Microbacterium enclense]|uniref:CaiB/BaiF CoA transferase family protein n=1 Tax=Microbacterium enclense TaxID=993073 RepID=UPI0036D96F65